MEDSGISQVFGKVLDTVNYGLNRYIDAEFNKPQTFNDAAGAQYAVGPDGRIYMRGVGGFITPSTGASGLSPVLMVALAVGLGLLLVIKH